MMVRATRRGAARAAILLGLAALSACSGGGTCTLQKVAEFPMAAGSPLPIVPVHINGHDVMMVLDSGAQGVFLTPGVARSLALRPDPRFHGKATGIGGSVTEFGVMLDRVALGSSELPHVFAGVLDQALPPAGSVTADGLLGMSVLNHYDIDLDMQARKATLYAGAACAASPPRWAGMRQIEARSLNGAFVIPVMLDGQPLHAMIDSGSEADVLFTDPSGVAFALRHRLPGQVLRGVGPHLTHAFIAAFDRLEVGGETLRSVPIVVTERREGMPDMVLGQPFLSRYRVWFSAQRRTLFIAPRPG